MFNIDIKEFLKPEISKFIVPIILLLAFTFFVYSFDNILKKIETLPCESLTLMKELDAARKNNDTEKITEVGQKETKLMEKYNLENFKLPFSQGNIFYKLITKIDLMFPLPCEILPEKNCKNYNNKESFECTIESRKYNPFSEIDIIEVQNNYNPLTIFDIIINIFVLFFEGYLLSCLIIWFYRKVKK